MPNSLYYYVKDYVAGEGLPHNITKTTKQTKDSLPRNYVLLKYKGKQRLSIPGYELREHHLSIYEYSVPEASSYHYTAKLKNSSGDHLILRVYFDNEHGCMTDYLSLKKRKGKLPAHATTTDAECIQGISKDIKTKFIEQATTKVRPLIETLRKGHLEQVASFTKKLEELNDNAASLVNEPAKGPERHLVIDQILAMLPKLSTLDPAQQGRYDALRTRFQHQRNIAVATSSSLPREERKRGMPTTEVFPAYPLAVNRFLPLTAFHAPESDDSFLPDLVALYPKKEGKTAIATTIPFVRSPLAVRTPTLPRKAKSATDPFNLLTAMHHPIPNTIKNEEKKSTPSPIRLATTTSLPPAAASTLTPKANKKKKAKKKPQPLPTIGELATRLSSEEEQFVRAKKENQLDINSFLDVLKDIKDFEGREQQNPKRDTAALESLTARKNTLIKNIITRGLILPPEEIESFYEEILVPLIPYYPSLHEFMLLTAITLDKPHHIAFLMKIEFIKIGAANIQILGKNYQSWAEFCIDKHESSKNKNNRALARCFFLQLRETPSPLKKDSPFLQQRPLIPQQPNTNLPLILYPFVNNDSLFFREGIHECFDDKALDKIERMMVATISTSTSLPEPIRNNIQQARERFASRTRFSALEEPLQQVRAIAQESALEMRWPNVIHWANVFITERLPHAVSSYKVAKLTEEFDSLLIELTNRIIRSMDNSNWQEKYALLKPIELYFELEVLIMFLSFRENRADLIEQLFAHNPALKSIDNPKIIYGVQYNSLMHYCLICGIKNDAVLACFHSLLDKNIPLLTNQPQLLAIEPQSQLPFIALIALDKNYSFFKERLITQFTTSSYEQIILLLKSTALKANPSRLTTIQVAIRAAENKISLTALAAYTDTIAHIIERIDEIRGKGDREDNWHIGVETISAYCQELLKIDINAPQGGIRAINERFANLYSARLGQITSSMAPENVVERYDFLVRQIGQYYGIVAMEIVQMLCENDSGAIGNLLAHRHAEIIDRKKFRLDGITYDSFIHFCFKYPGMKEDALIECFQYFLFLNPRPSLMQQEQLLEIDPESGLPFIVLLFCDPKYEELLKRNQDRITRDFKKEFAVFLHSQKEALIPKHPVWVNHLLSQYRLVGEITTLNHHLERLKVTCGYLNPTLEICQKSIHIVLDIYNELDKSWDKADEPTAQSLEQNTIYPLVNGTMNSLFLFMCKHPGNIPVGGTLLKQLQPYFQIDIFFIHQACLTNQIALIDYAFREYPSLIAKRISFQLNDKSVHSLIHFCFKNETKNEALMRCFAYIAEAPTPLIKQERWFDIEPDSKLPFIVLLFVDEQYQHLKKLFCAKQRKEFTRVLLPILQKHVSREDIAEPTRQKIAGLIEHCRNRRGTFFHAPAPMQATAQLLALSRDHTP